MLVLQDEVGLCLSLPERWLEEDVGTAFIGSSLCLWFGSTDQPALEFDVKTPVVVVESTSSGDLQHVLRQRVEDVEERVLTKMGHLRHYWLHLHVVTQWEVVFGLAPSDRRIQERRGERLR